MFILCYNFKYRKANLLICTYTLLQTSKNSLSELEKRERRAMERKLSEMEEELKVSISKQYTLSGSSNVKKL